jgi:branched-chain amino acid transport system permease protein
MSSQPLATEAAVAVRPRVGELDRSMAHLPMLAVGLAVAIAAPFLVSVHTKDLLVQAFIYGIFAISFDFLWGTTGILSLGHSAFFGIGAYAIGIAATQSGTAAGIPTGIAAGIVLSVALAAVMGWITFFSRVTPIYIAVITLSLALVLQRLVNLTSFETLSRYTGGYNGLSFGVVSWTIESWYWATLAVLTVVAVLSLVVIRSDLGRVLTGLRENERRLAYLGFRTPRIKLLVFMISAALAAFAGVIFGTYTQFASPDLLGLQLATYVLVLVLVGGRGTVVGPIGGAVFIGLVGAFVSDRYPEYWQLVLGLLFLFVVLFAREGLVPRLEDLILWGLRRLRVLERRTSGPVSSFVAAEAPGLPREAAASELLCRIRGFCRSYGSVQVLRGVDLDIRRGQILCVIGPNGAGKSTLINSMTDTRDLTAGSMELDGQPLGRRDPSFIARNGVGRTFQGTNLMEGFTVAESLFVASQRGSLPSLRRTFEIRVSPPIMTLLRATGLDDFADVRTSYLSHGVRQSLELAMALALEPELLLLDEPTAGLTHEERAIVGKLLRALIEERRLGIALIEHDLDFVRGITDEVAILDQGRVEIVGPVADVAESESLRTIYLGTHI